MHSQRGSRLEDTLLQNEPNFGTYHHSTSAASKKIRKVVKIMFLDALHSLPFQRAEELEILDVGCGLGFLSCVCAEFYTNSHILGIDTFEKDSLKDSSVQKAEENIKLLEFSERIEFKKVDVLRFNPRKKFDIIVSNLVFHNLGKEKFEAYSRVATWMNTSSFLVVGDLFFSPEVELAHLSTMFKIVRRINPRNFKKYALLVMTSDRSADS
jgi:ribosomal protein L11 methylase PrmA